MDASCPKCFRTGVSKETGETCTHCNGAGAIEVTLAAGRLFTRECLSEECGFQNGGYILQEDYLPEPPEDVGRCIMCDYLCRWLYLIKHSL
jgi:hypothetical protein